MRVAAIAFALIAAACTTASTSSSSRSALPTQPTPVVTSPSSPTSPDVLVVLDPSRAWAKPRTITLTGVDRLSVAVVHGPNGFYALDLRGVRECPTTIREGEGQYVDKDLQQIVFDCGEGSERARFDRYGRSVPGSPKHPSRPALAIEARPDGSLTIGKNPPSRPLTSYWPAALPGSPEDAAKELFDAWKANDKIAALEVASTSAVDAIWKSPSAGFSFSGRCVPGDCAFLNQTELIGFWLIVEKVPEGYFVREADLGTIESESPT